MNQTAALILGLVGLVGTIWAVRRQGGWRAALTNFGMGFGLGWLALLSLGFIVYGVFA